MYQRLFDVNVKGMFFVMQAVLARWSRPASRAAVINLASQAGRRGEALVSHYCASKAAVISYTQSAALAMAPHGIRVNAHRAGRDRHADVGSRSMRCSHATKGCSRARRSSRSAGGAAGPHGRARTTSPAPRSSWRATRRRYITAQTLNVDGGNVMS